MKLRIKKIVLNTFYLGEQITSFIREKNFPIDIQICEDGSEILNTGGGILNMINHSPDNDFLIFNPDTIWSESYVDEINKMQNFYFSKKLNNILMLTNKVSSFDKNLRGDFKLKDNLIRKNDENNFIYIGCQILNKSLFKEYQVSNFSISKVWNILLKKNELNGFESLNNFYHLTDLETFKKLEDF